MQAVNPLSYCAWVHLPEQVRMKEIVGKTNGLKASQIKSLEKLYSKRVTGDVFLSPELARSLCEASAALRRMVGVLIDRKGVITSVMLSAPSSPLYLPDVGRVRAGTSRLRGLRLAVAKPLKENRSGAYHVDSDFITDLEKLQLDAVVQVQAQPDGLPGQVALALLSPGERARHSEKLFRDIHHLDLALTASLEEIESKLKALDEHVKDAHLENERDRAVVVGVYTTGKKVWESSLRELKELCKTAGVRVVDTVIQQRPELDPRTIVGKGKLEEICLHALHKGAEMVIFDGDLSPSQLNAITDLTDLKILDRTMLILDIFARRATSRPGKLQVELAQLKYSLPRLSKKQSGLSRLSGGIGGQGPGETKLEIDKRRVKDKVARLEEEVEKLLGERKLRRSQRNENEVPTIAIVGYTNAGKSTLLNALTGASVYVKNALFATLDPTSRRLRFPKEREVIITDTVGFIRNLPEGLINAFRATLEELHEADLLLNVVDGTDPDREQHIEVVNAVLEELGLTSAKRLIVMNKIDLIAPEELRSRAERLGAIAVSAATRLGFEELLNRCAEELWHVHAIDHPFTVTV